jgi:hypothetical protein
MDDKELGETINEFSKFYKKHIFDDDQTICKNYHDMLTILKKKLRDIEKDI